QRVCASSTCVLLPFVVSFPLDPGLRRSARLASCLFRFRRRRVGPRVARGFSFFHFFLFLRTSAKCESTEHSQGPISPISVPEFRVVPLSVPQICLLALAPSR